MTERDECITCYERDEDRCYDAMCLRTGCRLRNDRSAARTGPDVAGFEAGRDAARMAALAQRCERGTTWDLACTTIAAAIAALPAPAGESVTVEVDISDVQFPLSKTALDAFQSGFKNQLRERHKNRFSDKPMISAEEAGLRAMLATITRKSEPRS